ncbi:hypothetical protein [Lederbergia galactosidilytica]|uniref:Phage protein n=1 Tax=Lederbergia galactosidilytica TaxID=217031 RepID=A0A177ZZC0_9BACI|nr:hypothetical protein [Lederbergia galactosidilytica]OAK72670.1 hypothetical protein ABB05_07375 [Lederbergia galactosidilytica]
MNRSLKEQLKVWKQDHAAINRHKQKKRKRRKEHFTDSELRSLMGMDRPIYGRGKGGAIRQK